ncbi:unnamed protein product, partial [Owenia fusiformis]
RSFFIQTKARRTVYREVPMSDNPINLNHVVRPEGRVHIEIIYPRDHFFDTPQRRKGHKERQFKMPEPRGIAPGQNPVRYHYKTDFSKVKDSVKAGVSVEEVVNGN